MKGRRPFKDCFRYSAAFLVIVAGACPDFEIYFQKKKRPDGIRVSNAIFNVGNRGPLLVNLGGVKNFPCTNMR